MQNNLHLQYFDVINHIDLYDCFPKTCFFFFTLAIKTCALIDLVIITQIALNSFWPFLIFFSPFSKNWFQMFELLKLKTSVCSGCKCMSKIFWNWVEFLWFNLMLVVHLSNIAKFCFNFVLIYYVLRFWTVYLLKKIM